MAEKTAAKKTTKKADSAAAPKIRIVVHAFDHRIADEATKTIVDTAQRSGAIIAGPIPMPTKIKKYTVNRSTFKHKTSREQFEMRTHKRLIDVNQSTPATITSLQNLTLPSGVDVEIKMK